DVEGLGGAEDVGEPQLDEPDASFFHRPQYVVPLALHVTSLSGRGVVGTGRRHGRPDSSTRPLGPARREPGVAIRLPPSTASSVAQGSDGSAGAGRAAD